MAWLRSMVPVLLATLAGCASEQPGPTPPSDCPATVDPNQPTIETLVCGFPSPGLGAGDGLAAALCRPGVDAGWIPGRSFVDVTHDASGRLSTVATAPLCQESAYGATVVWDDQDRVTGIVEDLDGDGVTDRRTSVGWGPDGVSGLTIEGADGAVTRVVTLTYTGGHLTSRVVSDGAGVPVSTERYTWVGDVLTTRELDDGAGAPVETAAYTNDPYGRLIERKVVDAAGATTSRTTWLFGMGGISRRDDYGPGGWDRVSDAQLYYFSNGPLSEVYIEADPIIDMFYGWDNDGLLDAVYVQNPAVGA